MAIDGWSSNHTMQVRVHRAFGYIAISGLICHAIYSTKISRRDPANQMIDYNYLGMCVEVTFLCGYGILYAIATSREQDEGRKHNFKRMHRFRMITCWFQGIFGSGAIHGGLVLTAELVKVRVALREANSLEVLSRVGYPWRSICLLQICSLPG